MKPQHVELVIAIAEAGSIRGAAEIMGKSQPALTKALRQAEASLGTAIFKRSPRGVVPTEHGQIIIARARVTHTEMRRLDEGVRQIQGDLSGNLDVIVSPLAAARIIPRAMASFRERFPAVHVQLTGGHAPAAYAPLHSGEADFVI